MTMTEMTPMVSNADGSELNAFLQDAYHMGTRMGSNLMIMHENHSTSECKYLILINTITGERKKITI